MPRGGPNKVGRTRVGGGHLAARPLKLRPGITKSRATMLEQGCLALEPKAISLKQCAGWGRLGQG
eukprot:15476191-Alexandrium_andersonii.AAC.1